MEPKTIEQRVGVLEAQVLVILRLLTPAEPESPLVCTCQVDPRCPVHVGDPRD